MNWLAILVAALVPTVVGFIWYHPKVMGTMWMQASGITEEDIQNAGNMGIIFGVSFLLSIMLALFLPTVTIHQFQVPSIFVNDPGFDDPNSAVGQIMEAVKTTYGGNFRTFKHGAFHGALVGLFFVLPVLGTNALFERKGAKYIFVNVAYWTLVIAIMGGIVCGWR